MGCWTKGFSSSLALGWGAFRSSIPREPLHSTSWQLAFHTHIPNSEVISCHLHCILFARIKYQKVGLTGGLTLMKGKLLPLILLHKGMQTITCFCFCFPARRNLLQDSLFRVISTCLYTQWIQLLKLTLIHKFGYLQTL